MKQQPIVLITGANRGLGKALADVFANKDYELLLHSRQNYNMKIEKSFSFSSCRFVPQRWIYGDLTNVNTLSLIEQAAIKKGIDIFINNAGVHFQGTICQTQVEDIKEILEVNLSVPIELTKRIWPIFKEQKSGLIININSIGGKQGSKNESIYCASKFGLRGFFDSLQYEATEHNIEILNTYFGAIKTDMTLHRENQDKLISAREAAKVISSFVDEHKTLRITSVNIGRKIY